MFLFNKKKKDVESDENENLVVPASNNETNTTVNAEVQLLKAKIIAQEEYRKTLIDRINRMTEEIGELRGMLITNQQSMEKLKVKTETTIGIVEAVKPEGLMSELKKVDAKSESLKARIGAIDDINTKIREELRDVREIVKSFRSVQEIIKLSDDIKADIITFKKIEVQVTKESSKVQSIFSSMQKNLSEFERLKNSVDIIAESQKRLDVSNIQTTQKINSLAKKEDVLELREHINKNIVYIDKEVGKIREALKEINTLASRMEEKEKTLTRLQDKINVDIDKNSIVSINNISIKLKELEDRITNYVDKTTFTDLRYLLLKDVSELTNRIHGEKKKFDTISKKLEKQNRQISEISRKIKKTNNKKTKK